MNSIKQLAGQTVVYGMGTIVPRVLNYALLTPFYSRIFSLGEYGVVTEIYAYMAILLILLTYGMETAFFRFTALGEYNKEKVYFSSLISLLATSLGFILLSILFSDSIADFLQYSGNRDYIIMFSLIVGIDAFSALPFARLRIENRIYKFAMIKIINVLVIVTVALAFLYFIPKHIDKNNHSVLEKIYSNEIGVGYVFIANLCGSLVTLILLLPQILKTRYVFSKTILKKILRYALPLLIAGMAGVVIETFDKASLKFLLPNREIALDQLGIYGANFKIAVLMGLFIQMFRYAAEPFFFTRAKDKNARHLYARVMNYFVLFCLLIFLFINFNINVFKHLVPEQYWIGLNVVPIILAAFVFYGIFVNLSIWYKLNDLTRYGAVITIIGATLTIVINIVFVPVYGYTASAWAHFISYLVMIFISYLWGRKIYKVSYDLKKISIYIVLTFIIYLIVSQLNFSSLFSELIIGNSILILFFVAIYYFEIRNKLTEFEANEKLK
ncbi:MAG: oligosaccharide flippase family protein [Bacteroidota bacterium]|nr:oligosaccharide flippase family protein [Bacteroidota bacterium]